MNRYIGLVILSLGGLIPSAASAHCRPHRPCPPPPRCYDTSRLVWVSAELVHAGACAQSEELSLGRTRRAYPVMGGRVYQVSYWKGSFRRADLFRDTYRRDFYDSCSGEYRYSDFVTGGSREVVAGFEVDNPNLSDRVESSIELVPMTDDEAKAALDRARIRCETER